MNEKLSDLLAKAASAAIEQDGHRIPLVSRDPGRAAVAATLRELSKDLRRRSSEYNADEMMAMAREIEHVYWKA